MLVCVLLLLFCVQPAWYPVVLFNFPFLQQLWGMLIILHKTVKKKERLYLILKLSSSNLQLMHVLSLLAFVYLLLVSFDKKQNKIRGVHVGNKFSISVELAKVNRYTIWALDFYEKRFSGRSKNSYPERTKAFLFVFVWVLRQWISQRSHYLQIWSECNQNHNVVDIDLPLLVGCLLRYRLNIAGTLCIFN